MNKTQLEIAALNDYVTNLRMRNTALLNALRIAKAGMTHTCPVFLRMDLEQTCPKCAVIVALEKEANIGRINHEKELVSVATVCNTTTEE